MVADTGVSTLWNFKIFCHFLTWLFMEIRLKTEFNFPAVILKFLTCVCVPHHSIVQKCRVGMLSFSIPSWRRSSPASYLHELSNWLVRSATWLTSDFHDICFTVASDSALPLLTLQMIRNSSYWMRLALFDSVLMATTRHESSKYVWKEQFLHLKWQNHCVIVFVILGIKCIMPRNKKKTTEKDKNC